MNENVQDSENIIIILTPELSIGATIVPENPQAIVPVYEDVSVKPGLEQVFAYLKDHNPLLTISSIKEDGSSFSGLREVPKDDPDYFTAFVEECNRQGLTCVVMPYALFAVVKSAMPQLSLEDRQKVLDQCLLMPEEEALQFCKDFQEALALGKESL